jgi:hypothetical protein
VAASDSPEDCGKEDHCKVVAMAEMLASAWVTYFGTSPQMCAAMAMVALPPALNVPFHSLVTFHTKLPVLLFNLI